MGLSNKIYEFRIGVEDTGGVEQVATTPLYVSGKPDFNPHAGGVLEIPQAGASYGENKVVPAGKMLTASVPVIMNGVAAAGDVPGWGAILRAMGHAETINAGTDVQYDPVLTGHEFATISGTIDTTRYKLIGAHVSSMSVAFGAAQFPTMQVGFGARSGGQSVDVTGASVSHLVPEAVEPGTSILTIDSYSACFSNLSIEYTVTAMSPGDVVCDGPLQIIDISASLKASVMHPGDSVKDFDSLYAGDEIACSFQHGTAGKGRSTVASAKMQVKDVQNGDINSAVSKELTIGYLKGGMPSWVID